MLHSKYKTLNCFCGFRTNVCHAGSDIVRLRHFQIHLNVKICLIKHMQSEELLSNRINHTYCNKCHNLLTIASNVSKKNTFLISVECDERDLGKITFFFRNVCTNCHNPWMIIQSNNKNMGSFLVEMIRGRR